jgi:DNA-binding CsgD family transcriptional regulator
MRYVRAARPESRGCHRRRSREVGIPLLENALERLPAEALSDRIDFAGDLCWACVRAGRHRDANRLITGFLRSVPHPEVVAFLWEHLLENAVYCWGCTGEWDRAREAVTATSRWRPDSAYTSNLWLARLDLRQRGRTDERPWRRLLGHPVPNGPAVDDVRLVLASAHAARGELAAMRQLAAPLLDPGAPDHEGAWLTVTDLSRAEAELATTSDCRPDSEEAALHLARMTQTLAAVQPPLPHDAAAALDLAAQLDRFHGRDARQSLQAALTAWAELDHLPDVAVTHLSLAEANAEAGDRGAAREHLAEGRRIATDLEALPWLDRATAIAHRYGFTTRDRRPDDVLTAREAEVLALLAEGRTNKEIAQTLFISSKTASVHVSRIIAKTGAGNRTEAVAIARRHGLLPSDAR